MWTENLNTYWCIERYWKQIFLNFPLANFMRSCVLGIDKSVPTLSSSYPCRLSIDRATGADRWNHGHLFVRADRNRTGHAWNVWIYVPRSCKQFIIIIECNYYNTKWFQGRALSRAKSRRNIDYHDVLAKLEQQGISIRVASPKLVMEESPESYKNVTDVVDTCHAAGISKKTVKLRPIAVIKG